MSDIPLSPQPEAGTLAAELAVIQGYHAHIYFDQATELQAQALIEQARQRFDISVGRMHCRPVGPHPCWSCQLSFSPAGFGRIIPWLVLHRAGLVVFVHPLTGDAMFDHRDAALWLGEAQPLDLSVLG